MKHLEFQYLKLEISVKAKKGIDFILAASIVWFAIGLIWLISDVSSYNKSVFTFIIGSILLPMAFGFSKILKTQWKVVNNPLQPLGLWLNFAQLFYFPFLVFVLLIIPDFFIMTYAIITGAHLFPYAWFYDDNSYAVMAGIISASSLIMGLNLSAEFMFWLPFFTSIALLIMAINLWLSIPRTRKKWKNISANSANI